MKLRTKIAGTLALPLALAVAANVNAAQITDELQVSGFVAATADWTMYDKTSRSGKNANNDSDMNFGLGLGTSRLGVTYVKNGVTYQYENDWNGSGREDSDGNNGNSEYRLRHAVIKYDGWEAGYTWSGFANRTALAETIDASGPTTNSANANRTAKLGKSFNVANGMKVGVFFEDHKHGLNTDGTTKGRTANTAIPDMVVNFNGDFGATKVFAAARLVNLDDKPTNKDKDQATTATDFAVGVSQNLIDDALNIKLAILSLDKHEETKRTTALTPAAPYDVNARSEKGRNLGVQLGAQYKINDQIRTNLVIEQVSRDNKDTDTTALWLNGFYKLNNGWEWGAELRYVSTDTVANQMTDKDGKPAKVGTREVNGLGNKDMSVSLLAKYSF